MKTFSCGDLRKRLAGIAIHDCKYVGADDPDRGAMGARMKALVAELTNQQSTKLKKDAATRELAKVREAYRRALLRA